MIHPSHLDSANYSDSAGNIVFRFRDRTSHDDYKPLSFNRRDVAQAIRPTYANTQLCKKVNGTNPFTIEHNHALLPYVSFSVGSFYLSDCSVTPDWNTNGDMNKDSITWKKKSGRIEGIRRKGWTIFTVVMIRLSFLSTIWKQWPIR